MQVPGDPEQEFLLARKQFVKALLSGWRDYCDAENVGKMT